MDPVAITFYPSHGRLTITIHFGQLYFYYAIQAGQLSFSVISSNKREKRYVRISKFSICPFLVSDDELSLYSSQMRLLHQRFRSTTSNHRDKHVDIANMIKMQVKIGKEVQRRLCRWIKKLKTPSLSTNSNMYNNNYFYGRYCIRRVNSQLIATKCNFIYNVVCTI